MGSKCRAELKEKLSSFFDKREKRTKEKVVDIDELRYKKWMFQFFETLQNNLNNVMRNLA